MSSQDFIRTQPDDVTILSMPDGCGGMNIVITNHWEAKRALQGSTIAHVTTRHNGRLIHFMEKLNA